MARESMGVFRGFYGFNPPKSKCTAVVKASTKFIKNTTKFKAVAVSWG